MGKLNDINPVMNLVIDLFATEHSIFSMSILFFFFYSQKILIFRIEYF